MFINHVIAWVMKVINVLHYLWKIIEGTYEKDKPRITWKVVSTIQVVGECEFVHPRVCWHCHKQVNPFPILCMCFHILHKT